MENTENTTIARPRQPRELTSAQHAILEDLAQAHESVRVTPCFSWLDGFVVMAPQAACPNCQPCRACNDEGLVPKPGASRLIVSPDGIVTDLGHVA